MSGQAGFIFSLMLALTWITLLFPSLLNWGDRYLLGKLARPFKGDPAPVQSILRCNNKHHQLRRHRSKKQRGIKRRRGLWRILSSNKWPIPVSIRHSGLASFQGRPNIMFDNLKTSERIWSSLFQHWPEFCPARALRDVWAVTVWEEKEQKSGGPSAQLSWFNQRD